VLRRSPQIAQARLGRRHEDSIATRAYPERVLPERMHQARCLACSESFHEESHGIGQAPIMCRTPAESVKATRRIRHRQLGIFRNSEYRKVSVNGILSVSRADPCLDAYLQTIRLHKAQALIAGGVSMPEAARQVGYESPSQFSREFKRFFDGTPKEIGRRSRSSLFAF
jgi:AraC-like DNA-binding protein